MPSNYDGRNGFLVTPRGWRRPPVGESQGGGFGRRWPANERDLGRAVASSCVGLRVGQAGGKIQPFWWISKAGCKAPHLGIIRCCIWSSAVVVLPWSVGKKCAKEAGHTDRARPTMTTKPLILSPAAIGFWTRCLRASRNWSQEALAAATDLDTRTIQRIESGKPSSVDTRRGLARGLGYENLNIFEDPEFAMWLTGFIDNVQELRQEKIHSQRPDHVPVSASRVTSGETLARLAGATNALILTATSKFLLMLSVKPPAYSTSFATSATVMTTCPSRVASIAHSSWTACCMTWSNSGFGYIRRSATRKLWGRIGPIRRRRCPSLSGI